MRVINKYFFRRNESDVDLAARQVTHFVPRLVEETQLSSQTRVSCCPGYSGDGEGGCVELEAEDTTETSSPDMVSLGDSTAEDTIGKDAQPSEDGPQSEIVDNNSSSDEEDFNESAATELESNSGNVVNIFISDSPSPAPGRWRWGEKLDRECACDRAGTRECSRVTGQCHCLASWTGDKCDVNNDFAVFYVLVIVFPPIIILSLFLLYRIKKMRDKLHVIREERALNLTERNERIKKPPPLVSNPLYTISIRESSETKPPPLCPPPAPVQDKDVVDETEEYDHLDYNRSVNDLSENYCSGIYV